MRRFVMSLLVLATAACGGGSAAPPSTPATPLPPVPSPTPSANPFAAACGTPLPAFADSYGFGIKVQLEPTKNKKILNASPAVRNMEYCQAAGFGPILICNTRKEDDPTRVPCDHYLSGISDQGVPGPNWFQDVGVFPNEQFVKCGEPGTTCSLKPENQYLLDINEIGRYVACGGEGGADTCGDCVILTMEQSTGSLGGLCKHR